MARKGSDENLPKKATDIDDVLAVADSAVTAFADRWIPAPGFDVGVEVMDVGQLRDAMGLRATIDWGDAWPSVEKKLLESGFRWHWLGGMRVMFLREKDGWVIDTGWQEVEEVNS